MMIRKLSFVVIGLVVILSLLMGCRGKFRQAEPAGSEEVTPSSFLEEVKQMDREVYTESWWSHVDLPELSMAERLKGALLARLRWRAYSEEANARAQDLSDRLEEYIHAWLRGEADARLPQGLLPPTIDSPKTHHWTLMQPEEVDPGEQWYVLPAHEVDPEYKKLTMHGVDHHVTYAKLLFVASLESRLLVEGDFPHARFMDFEILQPFDPQHPASGWMGETPEVPMVDVDIEPDPGHVNPFRVGADRNATKRHYHLTFELRAGNAVELNGQAMKSPEYRAPGNTRVGGPFGFAGPWGGGVLTPSILWLRIYAPDKGTEPSGGVSLPQVVLQLPSGERFWLQPDASLAIERQTTLVAAGYEPPGEPYPFQGSGQGWFKIFGLGLIRAEMRAYVTSAPWGSGNPTRARQIVRKGFELLFNRGPGATPPGNYESSATACNYNSFLTRNFRLGSGQVYAMTGRLPRTPRTRDGEPVMTGGEARYWSISHYGRGEGDQYSHAVHYGGLMDDEIITNEEGDYVIVYSLPEDRPSNARPECGVTWQDWGPRSRHTVTIRWMSVIPEWHLPEYAPDEVNIPWERGAWSQAEYDERLVGRNEPGVMGPYHPVIHYLSRKEFEALGCPVDPAAVPEWK